ncbi:MAG: SseB family protein [Actinomyces sp.]|uniref:SseB family protein n=1 Tax=Actinomyces sp. TaxID=29317 RepID=UPI0026DC55E6|nr:SseB family protein [Actinomyces sp.]MDO4243690.1 SseB family protein [Actinomyces sp.]
MPEDRPTVGGRGEPPAQAAHRRLARLLAAPTAFPHDDGAVAPAVARALTEADGHRRLERLLAALSGGRVLVPVDPHPRVPREGCGSGGDAGVRTADPACPAVKVQGGRLALPVFTGAAALAAWRPRARPVPVAVGRAAGLARREADGLWLVDPGTVDLLVPRTAVAAVARGEAWVPPWRDGRLVGELERRLGAVPGVEGARLGPGAGAGLRVLVLLDPQGARQVQAVLAECGRVVSDPAWGERLEAVELCPVPPTSRGGEGHGEIGGMGLPGTGPT